MLLVLTFFTIILSCCCLFFPRLRTTVFDGSQRKYAVLTTFITNKPTEDKKIHCNDLCNLLMLKILCRNALFFSLLVFLRSDSFTVFPCGLRFNCVHSLAVNKYTLYTQNQYRLFLFLASLNFSRGLKKKLARSTHFGLPKKKKCPNDFK